MVKQFGVQTQGFCDVVNITGHSEKVVSKSGVVEGLCLISVAASTCGITTIEYEDGAISDFKKTVEKLIPQDGTYEHNKRWGDGNGFSHIRSSFFTPTLTLPIVAGELVHGIWQQVVLVDFDNRPRTRNIQLTLVGN